MSIRLGLAAILGLVAFWIAYRDSRQGGEVLPPPDPKCQRGTVEAIP